MKPHKLATLFPEITGEDFNALVLDIKANGLRQKITTLDGKILDGVNRFKACVVAGVKAEFVEYSGDDPMAFVVSQNMSRRHLTTSQRAAVAAEMATTKHGGRREQAANSPLAKITNGEAAGRMNVSERSVRDARSVKLSSPRKFNDVKSGKLSLNAATNPKPRAKGGLTAEALAARDKKPLSTSKDRALAAIDEWWEIAKQTLSYVTPKPAQMVADIRAAVEKALT